MAGNLTRPFIGKKVSITKASNQSYIGVEGVVVDETKNAFVVQVQGVKKTVLKKGTTFQIEGKEIIGNKITKRIEERIKS